MQKLWLTDTYHTIKHLSCAKPQYDFMLTMIVGFSYEIYEAANSMALGHSITASLNFLSWLAVRIAWNKV